MCILFFIVGDETHPTIICSNRDEYYMRPTQRGRLVSENRYMPQDLEQGGTWLVFDQLGSDDESLKFAIVLNYHDWRDDLELVDRDLSVCKTRGRLVTDFVDGHQSASDYATSIYAHRDQYRPFNLIVSDASGTFYISCSKEQDQGPEKLRSGHFYGISNGFMWGAWQKVTLGLRNLSSVLSNTNMDSLRNEMKQSVATYERHNVSLPAGSSTGSPLAALLASLLTSMKDSTPLDDPTFQSTSKALSRLASIYVLPTLILKGSGGVRSLADLLPFYQLLEDLLPGEPLDHAHLFGTRTVTLLIHGGKDWLGAGAGRFALLESELDGSLRGESVQLISNISMDI